MAPRRGNESGNESRTTPPQHSSQHKLPLDAAKDGPHLTTAIPTAGAAAIASKDQISRAPLAQSRDCYTTEGAVVGAFSLAAVAPGSRTYGYRNSATGSPGANTAAHIPSRTRVAQGAQREVQPLEYGSTQESAYTSQIAPDIPVGSPKASKLSSKERRKATFTHKKIQESRAMRKEKKRNKEEEEKQERNPHGQSFTNKADDVPETGNSLGSKPSHWETQSLWDMANGPLRQCWLPLLYRWDGWNWVPLPGGYYLLPQPSTPPYHPSYLNQPQDFEYPGYSQHSSTLYDSKDASDAAWPMESSPALTEKGPNTSRPKGEVPAIRIDDSLLIAVSPTPALHKSNSPTTELVTDARKESRLSLSTPNDSNTSPPDAVVATGLNDLAAIGAQHDEANTGAVIEPRDFDVTTVMPKSTVSLR